MEEYTTGTGQKLTVHEWKPDCDWNHCVIHYPSEHSMKGFPTHWRSDRYLMERVCPHGIGHPDPDDLRFKERTKGSENARVEAVHGCDGCCRGAVPKFYSKELGND